jgi:hypothetical protein
VFYQSEMDLTDEEQGLFMPPNELDNNETYRERYSVEDRTINTKFKTAALFYVSVLAVFSLILNVHKGLDVGKSDIGRQVDAILTATPLIGMSITNVQTYSANLLQTDITTSPYGFVCFMETRLSSTKLQQ